MVRNCRLRSCYHFSSNTFLSRKKKKNNPQVRVHLECKGLRHIWEIFPSSVSKWVLQRCGKYFILFSAGVWGTSAFSISLYYHHFPPKLYKLKPERSSIIQESLLNFQFLKLIIKMVPNVINYCPIWRLLLMKTWRIHLSDWGLHLSSN